VVLNLIRGQITLADVACQHGLTLAEVKQWKARFLA